MYINQDTNIFQTKITFYSKQQIVTQLNTKQ